MEVTTVDKSLYYVNISNFLSTWVYKDEDLCFLVDPGPSFTIKLLKKNLEHLKIGSNDLDFILLTHVHIDHAGGVGNLIEYFPRSKIICHPNGIKHLINPEKLWRGSLKVLGKAAELYGKIKPVPKNRIQFQKNVRNGIIKVIETLGHAPHHQSYIFDKTLFVGEATGFSFSTPEFIYMRPATPPIFDYDIYVDSIQKLLSMGLSNHRICYPHFGMRDNAHLMINHGYKQISTWLKVINNFYEKRKDINFMENLISELKKEDQIFSNSKLLDKEIRSRNSTGVKNSIYGILGYIEKKKFKNIKV